jgi:hypothetical protein
LADVSILLAISDIGKETRQRNLGLRTVRLTGDGYGLSIYRPLSQVSKSPTVMDRYGDSCYTVDGNIREAN